tara:strand:+ start:2792 stop:3691 length:900 start_codon:yes stop_codon:yes gene_type:complete
MSWQSQAELEALNKKIFGKELQEGSCVETMLLPPVAADKFANYCKIHWSAPRAGFVMPNNVHAPGFFNYGFVLVPTKQHSTHTQDKDTALFEHNLIGDPPGKLDLLVAARVHLPGFKEMELQTLAQVQQHAFARGRRPFTVSANALRQRGNDTDGTSNFAVHLDTWSFEHTTTPALTIVIKTTKGIGSRMNVLGAREDYAYPEAPGAAAVFPSGCAHSSVPTKSHMAPGKSRRLMEKEWTFKLVFFVGFLDYDEDVELAYYAARTVLVRAESAPVHADDKPTIESNGFAEWADGVLVTE